MKDEIIKILQQSKDQDMSVANTFSMLKPLIVDYVNMKKNVAYSLKIDDKTALRWARKIGGQTK